MGLFYRVLSVSSAKGGDRLMTFIVQGFLALITAIVSWFPSSETIDIPAINVVGQNLSGWIDIASIVTVIGLVTTIYAAFGIAFLVNWIIKRVRGG